MRPSHPEAALSRAWSLFDIASSSVPAKPVQNPSTRLAIISKSEADDRRQGTDSAPPEPRRRGARFGPLNLLVVFSDSDSSSLPQYSTPVDPLEGWDAENPTPSREALSIFAVHLGTLRDLAYKLDPPWSASCKQNGAMAVANHLTAAACAWKLLETHLAHGARPGILFRGALRAIALTLVRNRDVQTLACLSAMCSLAGIDLETFRFPAQALHAYSDLLQRTGQFERRCEFERAHMAPAQLHGEIVSSVSSTPAARCALCRVLLSRSALVTCCIKCGHGGHVQHLRAWFAKNRECPTACGCLCAGTSL
jgi:hypothetical protein